MLLASMFHQEAPSTADEALGELRRDREVCTELVELLDVLRRNVTHTTVPLDPDGPVPLAGARPLHAAGDPGCVRRRRHGLIPPRWDSGVKWLADSRRRPACVHARQVERRLLPDDPIPRLRDQPRPHPLGIPVGDVACQPDRPALPPPRSAGVARSCCSHGSAPTTAPSGVSDQPRTSATRASARSRSPGDWSTACQPTSSPSSLRLLLPEDA